MMGGDSQPVAGIILAAGRSRRFGSPKALIHVGGRPAIEGLIAAFAEARLSPVIAVAAAGGEVQDILRGRSDVAFVAGEPRSEMIESLARGIAATPDHAPAAVVQPVDAPFTTAAMIAALLSGNPGTARVLCHEGRAGHPVLVPRSLFAEIVERPRGGLRALLADVDVEVVEWSDRRVLADIDTPEDLALWRDVIDARIH
jgi:CTP:molybdopterin cytidylyltransferase MocA